MGAGTYGLTIGVYAFADQIEEWYEYGSDSEINFTLTKLLPMDTAFYMTIDLSPNSSIDKWIPVNGETVINYDDLPDVKAEVGNVSALMIRVRSSPTNNCQWRSATIDVPEIEVLLPYDIAKTAEQTAVMAQQRDQLAALAAATQAQTTAIQQQSAAIQNLTNKDTEPPTVTVKWDKGATITTSSSYTLHVIASDNSGGPLQMRLNGGAWQAYTSTVSVPLSLGYNEVVVEIRDASGNTASAKAGIFKK